MLTRPDMRKNIERGTCATAGKNSQLNLSLMYVVPYYYVERCIITEGSLLSCQIA